MAIFLRQIPFPSLQATLDPSPRNFGPCDCIQHLQISQAKTPLGFGKEKLVLGNKGPFIFKGDTVPHEFSKDGRKIFIKILGARRT